MKIVSILLAMVNTLASGLVVASCLSFNQLDWESMSWWATKIVIGVFVMAIGFITWRDAIQPIRPGRMLLSSLALLIVGVACILAS